MTSNYDEYFVVVCTGGSWQEIDGKAHYVRSNLRNFGVDFPSNINFEDLSYLIKMKTGMLERGNISLSFQHPTMGYVIEMIDDSDVRHLIKVVQKSSSVVYVYLVDNGGVVVENGPLEMVTVEKQLKEQEVEISGVNPPRRRGKGKSSKKKGVAIESHNATGLSILPIEYDNMLDVVDDTQLSYTKADPYEDESKYCMSLSDLEREDTGIEWSDDGYEYTNKYTYAMPPTPPCSGPVHEHVHSHSQSPSERIKEGQTFKDKEAFKLALGVKAIREKFQYKTDRSTPTRFQASCLIENCTWKITGVTLERNGIFQVRKLIDTHSCSKGQLNPNHRQGNKKVLGHLIAEVVAKDHNRVLRGADIVRDFGSQYNVNISYKQAWRGKEHALNILRGCHEESFARLPLYCHNLKKHNPGTFTYIQTDSEDRFEHVFVALGCMIRAFLRYCRPTLVVDAAHLKGEFKGTMLLAVAMDGNNQILPVAYGICKSECTESWTWFLQKLHSCIGDSVHFSFISDRAPSIARSIADVFPLAQHGVCGKHLYNNVETKFGHNDKTKGMFWKTVKAYTVFDYEESYNCLRRNREPVWEYLELADPRRWARALFPGNRYNLMTSNAAESINSLSRHARKLPIIMLIDFFRETMQKWSYERRTDAAKTTTKLTDWADKKVRNRRDKVKNWTVRPIEDQRFEVQDTYGNAVVDFNSQSCSCVRWQKSGLPCGHVIRVLTVWGYNDCSDMAFPAFKKDSYYATYAQPVEPLPAVAEWENPGGLPVVKPPLMEKRQSGRPRNVNRIPSQGEGPIIKECSRCNEKGHTRNNCPAFMPRKEEEEYSRKGKSKINMGSSGGSETDNVYPTYDLDLNM